MRSALTISLLIVAVAASAAVFVLLGIYDVAADKPHWPATHAALELLRERSIAVRAARITPPDLTHPELTRAGAGNYESMCSGCHLRPGLDENELSVGLYPRPPSWRE